jgi:hypothetical protein
MKRIRLLVLLSALAVALPVGVLSGIAKATGGTTTKDQVSINQYADYDLPSLLQVGLQVRCYGGEGLVTVQVDQYPPETPYLVTFGSGAQPVVCDGRTHAVSASVVGEGYDAGKALATATLVGGTGKVTVVKRWIIIRVV